MKYITFIIALLILQSCVTTEDFSKSQVHTENKITIERLGSLSREKQSIDLLVHELPGINKGNVSNMLI